jgi:hypothetical protein
MEKYKFYRRLTKGTWYQHKFTKDALQLCFTFQGIFWARYANINRYSKVITTEIY